MSEFIPLIQSLIRDFDILKVYVLSLKKSQLQQLQDAWVDGQDVMQALHISKRTLQSLRDNGMLPYSRIKGKFYYKVGDIENLLESNYFQDRTERRNHGH